FSQASSVASSVNLPLDRLSVHLPMHPTAFPIPSSHFKVVLWDRSGIVPVSSPPKGVPAIATAIPAASATTCAESYDPEFRHVRRTYQPSPCRCSPPGAAP